MASAKHYAVELQIEAASRRENTIISIEQCFNLIFHGGKPHLDAMVRH